MTLQEVKIYRMTHIDNVPHILLHGITKKNSLHANPNYVNIGDVSLINSRNNKRVLVENGNGLNFNAQAIVLGDHIPFYFGLKMPMLYVMQNGGNFVEKATPPQNIIYIACSLEQVLKIDCAVFYSDGHATDNMSTFFDRSRIAELPTVIDWPAVKASYWAGQENLNVKRKKQAEFLVGADVPANCIAGFGCYNENAKQKLIAIGVEEKTIKLIPNAYF